MDAHSMTARRIGDSVVERIAPHSFLRALIHDAQARPVNASTRRRHPTARQKRVVKERDRTCVDCGGDLLLEYDHTPRLRHVQTNNHQRTHPPLRTLPPPTPPTPPTTPTQLNSLSTTSPTKTSRTPRLHNRPDDCLQGLAVDTAQSAHESLGAIRLGPWCRRRFRLHLRAGSERPKATP